MSEIKLLLDAPYQINLAELEKQSLRHIMRSTKYNQSKAANKMGISRGTLRTKLKEYFGTEYFRDSE